MVNCSDHFQQNSAARRVEEATRQRWFIDNRQRREKAIERAEDADAAALDTLAVALLATPAEIEAFQAELDVYDEATVKALMENERQLDEVEKELDSMLAEAHVLEDGRRVFKTEDGTKIYDEFGLQVERNDIDPDSIANHKPKWEPYKSVRHHEKALRIERQSILEFQDKLDYARERSEEKGFTKQERDDFKSDLENAVPDSVTRHLPEDHLALQKATITPDFENAALRTAPTQLPEFSAPAPSPMN